MNIGIIKKVSYTPKGSDKKKSFLEMSIRPPLMESSTFMIVVNDKQKDSEPDYSILYNFSRKGESYKPTKVGAIWNKTSKDGQTNYKDGYIEHPLSPTGKFYITIFEAKSKDGEQITYTHDVVWSVPMKKDEDEQQYQSYIPQQQQETRKQESSMPQQQSIEIDDDKIPF